MELTPEIYELIEQYLNGELKGGALQDFEKRIAADKELAEEVAFQREMQAFLAETQENELRKNLQILSDQVVEPKEAADKGWFWWLLPAGAGETNVLDWLLGSPARHLAWILPLLLVAGWWLFNRNDLEIIDRPIVGTDSLENNSRLGKIDSTETIAVDLPAYNFSIPPTIYWYNSEVEPKIDFFDPNIYFGRSTVLDSLMIATRQNGDFKIELVDNPEVIFLAENTSWTDTTYQKVPLKLVIETEKDLFQQDPVLYVKDNRGNAYGPFPLLENLQLDGENRYIVQTEIPLWDNTPRLVYYTIEDYETKAPYFVDRIEVLPKDSIFEKSDFPWIGPRKLLSNLSRRVFEPGEVPDFFAADSRLDSAIANNLQSDDFRIATRPTIPDTFYMPDNLLILDPTLSDSLKSVRQAYLDSIFTFKLIVHSTENLFEEGLHYKTVDNVNFHITQSNDDGYTIEKKYGTDTYFFDLKIGYASDYPEGLYYYQISAGSKTFTGKYIILPTSTID